MCYNLGMKKSALIVVFALVSSFVAQAADLALNRIPGMTPVAIPAGVGAAAALDAVEKAVQEANPNGRARSWMGAWNLVQRDPGGTFVLVELSVRQHSLQVCYRIENGALVPDVPSSVNLRQAGTSIHPKAVQWAIDFSPRVRRYVNAAALPPAAAPAATPAATNAPAAAAPAAPAAPAAAKKRFCDECGKPVGEKAKFCGECGHKL